MCGAREHVPATAALDVEHDATLPRWTDLVVPDATQVVPVQRVGVADLLDLLALSA